MYQPHPLAATTPATTCSVADAEKLLESWFGRPVVLLSAGRTGLRGVLQLLGLQRHHDTLRIPRFISRCVMNAVTFQALPVETAGPASATLVYHQFGFPLVDAPEGRVIEDVAHAFFGTAMSGSRRWLGDFAIFSLPKFFPMAGLAGGVITRTRDQADEIRGLAQRSAPASPGTLDWMRAVYSATAALAPGATVPESSWIDAVYELLFRHQRPDPASLPGLPISLQGLQEVGQARAARARYFLGAFKGSHPTGLWPQDEEAIPYALPYFGRNGQAGLLKAKAALLEQGFDADLYHVDVRRSAASPEYRQSLLIPGHQEIPMDRFEAMCRLLDASDRDARS